MRKLIKCQTCEKEISINSRNCIHCGEPSPLPEEAYKRKMKYEKELELENFKEISDYSEKKVWIFLFKMFIITISFFILFVSCITYQIKSGFNEATENINKVFQSK